MPNDKALDVFSDHISRIEDLLTFVPEPQIGPPSRRRKYR